MCHVKITEKKEYSFQFQILTILNNLRCRDINVSMCVYLISEMPASMFKLGSS